LEPELNGMFMRLRGGSRIHLRLIAAFLFSALQFATASLAQEIDDPCDKFGTSAVTFVGRVGPLEHRPFKQAPDTPVRTLPLYPAVVVQAFRGVEANHTAYLQAGMLDEPLQAEQQYLIYGEFIDEAHTVINPARLPTPVDRATADLGFLTSQESSATTGRIYGVVQRGSIYGEANRQMLPGIKLRVRVGDSLTETTSDEHGRFDVAGLPEGYFRIEADLPPELTTSSTGGGEVRAGGCVRTGVVAQRNGIIRGHVMGADQRPIRVFVHLLPTDPRTEGFPRQGQVKLANDSGGFEFAALHDQRRARKIRRCRIARRLLQDRG
jgi:hypothetical protein